MSAKDSVQKTLIVAGSLCLVCSLLVSGITVSLRPLQEKNKEQDKRKNILLVAGLFTNEGAIDAVFSERVRPHVVNVATGEYDTQEDPLTYDERKAVKDPKLAISIAPRDDIAGIRTHAPKAVVYEILDTAGSNIEQYVLPVYGKGLWSTLFGFISLQPDMQTVKGLGFYQHGETPGLGGEVDNPRWKAKWDGKKLRNEHGQYKLQVIKGMVDPEKQGAEHQVDGLSGATITSRGVSELVRFWLGPKGFGPFIANKRQLQRD